MVVFIQREGSHVWFLRPLNEELKKKCFVLEMNYSLLVAHEVDEQI